MSGKGGDCNRENFKNIIITFLIIGGFVFLFSIPQIFSTVLVKTIGFLDDSPKVDSNGRTIYEDSRNTIMLFDPRKEFEIVKFAYEEYRSLTPLGTRWCLFDRDNNKSIEPDAEGYYCSPCVYKSI